MTLIENIGTLCGVAPANGAAATLRGTVLGNFYTMDDAWLLVDPTAGTIIEYGSMSVPCTAPGITGKVDAGGEWVFPSFCDSHTHLVFAGSRDGEFADRLAGLDYAQIAARGGGILNSVDRLRQASEDSLYDAAMVRVSQIIAKGTGAVEIKSGYGLSLESELKMLRVVRRIREDSPLRVVSTFLGAHAVPREYVGHRKEYIDLICREMMPAIGREGLADYTDIFCERGFFTPDDACRVFEAAAKYGIKPRLHANQLAVSGGVQAGVRAGAVSVDHLESIGKEEIELLGRSSTVATLLPGASFFLDMQYAPARRLIDAGACVALASDYNPGSSPSGDMRFVVSLACIKMRMSVEEALNAATVNGAAAMGLGPASSPAANDRNTQGLSVTADGASPCGTIARGFAANFFFTRPLSSVAYLAYAYTTPLITQTWLNGKPVYTPSQGM